MVLLLTKLSLQLSKFRILPRLWWHRFNLRFGYPINLLDKKMLNKVVSPSVALIIIVALPSLVFSQNTKNKTKPVANSKLSQHSHSWLTIGSSYIPPLSNSKQTGVLDLLIKEAFTRNGLQVTIVHHATERVITNTNEGIDDGDISRIGGLSRLYPNLVQVPEKLFDMDFVAFTKNSDIKLENWESLNQYSIGIITGWKILEENTRGVSLLTKVQSPESLFTLIQADRAEIVLYDRIQGLCLIKELGFNEIKVLEPPLAVREMYFYLNKKHEKLVPEIDNAFIQMKKDGTYKRIFDKLMSEHAY